MPENALTQLELDSLALLRRAGPGTMVLEAEGWICPDEDVFVNNANGKAVKAGQPAAWIGICEAYHFTHGRHFIRVRIVGSRLLR